MLEFTMFRAADQFFAERVSAFPHGDGEVSTTSLSAAAMHISCCNICAVVPKTIGFGRTSDGHRGRRHSGAEIKW